MKRLETSKRKTKKMTIEVEYTTDEARDALLALLGGISHNCGIGASRSYGVIDDPSKSNAEDDGFKPVFFDGDGADQLWFKADGEKVERIKPESSK